MNHALLSDIMNVELPFLKGFIELKEALKKYTSLLTFLLQTELLNDTQSILSRIYPFSLGTRKFSQI